MFSHIKSVFIVCTSFVAFTGVFQSAVAQTEENKALIRDRWLDMVNTANSVIADEIFAADFTCHAPHYPQASDLPGYKAEVVSASTVIADFQAVLEDLMAEGDTVVGRFTATGKWPPAGIPYTNTWIIFFRFADGKIAEEWWQYDLLGVQQQLGMLPPTRDTYTWGEPSQVTGDPGDPETNKATVERMIEEVMNQQNLAVIDELFAADYVMHDPAWPGPVTGPEGFKQWAGAMLEPFFSDGDVGIGDMIAEGDKVVVRWTWSGTHAGEFMGIPATGRRITVTGISIHRFADGKFVESWASYDSLGMMGQLTAEEWSLAGAWFGTNNYGHVILLTVTPLGSDDERFAVSGDISHDPTFGGMFPDAVAETAMRGTFVRTGLNTYAFTIMSHGLGEPAQAEGSARQVVYTMVASGELVLTGADTMAADSYTAAMYAPDQDPFGEEPPAYGCVPVSATYKRVPMVPPCELPPPEPVEQ
jgi:steroid delta-isomerase-like uncharacterized protein